MPDETLLEYTTRACVWCTRAGGNTAEREQYLSFLVEVRISGYILYSINWML
jgi:hypothetical protein